MSPSRSQKITILKILLSVAIIYHVAVTFIMPNSSSYLGRASSNYLLPYANLLGLNTTWNFFSPDPANTIFFEYSVRFEDQLGNELREAIHGVLPEEKESIVTDSSRRRFLYAVRYLMLDPHRLELLFAPWLCRAHVGASRVSIKQVTQQIVNLDMAVIMPSESAHERPEISSQFMTYNCPSTGAVDEVSGSVQESK